jgi:vacuolar-type H+-ATPase subunit C/Vma6
MITEAQKRASKAYRERIKGTERGEELRLKQNEYSRKAGKKRYNNDEEYRLNKIKAGCDKGYYNNPDQILKSVRKLFM